MPRNEMSLKFHVDNILQQKQTETNRICPTDTGTANNTRFQLTHRPKTRTRPRVTVYDQIFIN